MGVGDTYKNMYNNITTVLDKTGDTYTVKTSTGTVHPVTELELVSRFYNRKYKDFKPVRNISVPSMGTFCYLHGDYCWATVSYKKDSLRFKYSSSRTNEVSRSYIKVLISLGKFKSYPFKVGFKFKNNIGNTIEILSINNLKFTIKDTFRGINEIVDLKELVKMYEEEEIVFLEGFTFTVDKTTYEIETILTVNVNPSRGNLYWLQYGEKGDWFSEQELKQLYAKRNHNEPFIQEENNFYLIIEEQTKYELVKPSVQNFNLCL